MIVKEINWDGKLLTGFKKLLTQELFDKIGIAISTKWRNNPEQVTEELLDEYDVTVKNYFAKHIATNTEYSVLLPAMLKDVEKFYIFGVHVLPTGGVLITFVAMLGGSVSPCELQIIY